MLKDEKWKNVRSIVSPTFSTAKLKAVNLSIQHYLFFDNHTLQMYGLMNEISDTYNKRLLEYADKQEIFDIKVYVYLLCLLFKVEFYFNGSINGQYTLDNIASCLFGIETNSLQNENVTLINHLKSFFKVNLASLFILVTL